MRESDRSVDEVKKERLRERRRQNVYAAYAEAANDPEFMREMLDTVRAFEHFDIGLEDEAG